ncbi:NUDIX hydrolase domain-like protein [Podospora conica]|nr:NUDIX hydrolase domain-like protein [Schizothecium conicum]
MPPPPPNPPITFTHPPSLAPFAVPLPTFLASLPAGPTIHGITTSILVFDSHNRILLLQRAAHDSMPGQWECPGGAVDAEDPTILDAAMRELWEEAGLRGERVVRFVEEAGVQGLVGGERVEERGLVFEFVNRKGVFRRFYRVAFEVVVEGGGEGTTPVVVLDPEEHQDYLWAGEEEHLERIPSAIPNIYGYN